MTAESKPLHVFGDDCEWVIAYDLEDAQRVYEEYVGAPVTDQADRWSQEPDTGTHACNVGPDGKPDDGGHGESETLTNAEWAARLGRGYFCTTEY
jgi:hypothetical protein